MKTSTFSKLTLIVVALTVSLFANAQVKFGPIAGNNLANVGGDVISENVTKIGFHVGGIVEISVNDNFMVAPGIIYSMKGTRIKSNSDFKTNLNYLEIPVNAKYKLESGLNFFAGPYIGILMSAKSTHGTKDVDVKEFFQSTDIGVNIGLGFDRESGFGISAQYGLGISNINKKDFGSIPSTSTNTNNCIGISIRYMLGDN